MFLPGESQGRGSLVGCHLQGCTESDTTEATLQQFSSSDRMGFLGSLVVKDLPDNAGVAGDLAPILGSGRSPRGGNGNPLQYFCLENPMDRGAWQTIVHRVAKSRTRLSN